MFAGDKIRLGAQQAKWLRADVWPNGFDEKAGSYKASSPFNGHFVLVWLVVSSEGKNLLSEIKSFTSHATAIWEKSYSFLF